MTATLTKPPAQPITATYETEAFRVYVKQYDPVVEKEVTRPIWVRRIFLTTSVAIGDSGRYKISYAKRKWSVSVHKRVARNKWDNPTAPGQAWWELCYKADKDGEMKPVYVPTEYKGLSEIGVLKWLAVRLGSYARACAAVREVQA